MKVEFNQDPQISSIKLIPENIQESSQLIRLAINARKVKPLQLFYNLSDEPYFYIDLLTIEKNEVRFLEKK